MKISQADYDQLAIKIEHIAKPFGGIGTVKISYEKAGLSPVRMRWDFFHKAGQYRLYDYLNDEHIDTALRKITNTKKDW